MYQVRSERNVLSQVQAWAKRRENVRAVVLTSSRVDPRRTPDVLSDYDIEVYVRDPAAMMNDDAWLTEFGDIMVRWPLQPQPTFSPDWITQLVLFDDGVRIDFQITDVARMGAEQPDGPYSVLVDKDGLTGRLPPPPTDYYGILQPTAKAFAERVNAFWWDIIYVAKGLWRGELNYAKFMLDGTIRFDKLLPLMTWYIGIQRGWPVDVGIHGRWCHRYLDQPTWEHYQRTFAGATEEDNWRALIATLTFVRVVGNQIAQSLGYTYPTDVDRKVTRFIEEIKALERT